MTSFLAMVTCALLAAMVLPSAAAAQNTAGPSKWNPRSFTALSWAVYTNDEPLPSSADDPTAADTAKAEAEADAAETEAETVAGTAEAEAQTETEPQTEAETQTETQTDPDAREPRECKPRYMVGPGMGIPLGAGSVIGGAVFTAIGVGTFSSTEPKIIGIGATMMAVGIGTLAFSMVKLRKNKERRRELCDQWREPADWRR